VLRRALAAEPGDGRAAGLLGHWSYDRRRYADAIALWRAAVEADPTDPVCWRNLGIAACNVLDDADEALACFQRAVAAAPDDGRLRYERDQLAKRVGRTPAERLAVLEERLDLVGERDDLTVEYVALLLAAGRAGDAVDELAARHFQPWEGGEGQALGAWERTHLQLARGCLAAGEPERAETLLRAALTPPRELGEAPHLLANRSDLLLVLGDALAGQGRDAEAATAWREAAEFTGDFQEMAPQPYSEKTYWSALAWQRLGEDERAAELLAGVERYSAELGATAATVDYFATSLPTLLLFSDDLQQRRATTALFLQAQVAAARGDGRAGGLLARVLAADPNHAGAQDLQQAQAADAATSTTASTVEEDQ